tara:strand:- start:11 stop:664 length:654 start_codon:yes stop_codon:yes gene_type:complete
MLTITAISGWAVPESWFAEQVKSSFPNSDIKIVYPENPESAREAKIILNQFQSQIYIGYSLGSLWLLKYQQFLPKNCKKAIIAPILALLNKKNLGGKISESQLKILINFLSCNTNKIKVLKDFFSFADLPYPVSHIDTIRDKKTLIKGLEFLKNTSVTGKETNDFLSIIGENDAFIDAGKLKFQIPHLKIVDGAGHSPTPLLNKLAQTLQEIGFNIK